MQLTQRLIKSLLYLSVFLIPFYFFRFSIFGLPTNVLEVAVIILMVFTLVEMILKLGIWELFRSVRLIRSTRNLLIVSFLLVAFLGVWKAGFSREALGIFKGWFLIPILLYFSVINIISHKEIKNLAIPLFVSLMIISSWSILQRFGLITTLFYQRNDNSFSQYLSGNFRVFGPFESPNYLAMYLVPTLFLSLPIFNLIRSNKYSSNDLERSEGQNSRHQYSGSNNILSTILCLLYALPLSALVFSGSRAGVIALTVSAIIYLFITKKDSVGSKILYYGLVGVTALAGIMFFYKYGFDPKSDNIRIQIYHFAYQLLKDNWLYGLGLGSFQEKLASLTLIPESFKTFALPYAIHPHNIFLAYWLNLGLIGIITFLAIIINSFVKIFKNHKDDLIFAGTFMAMSAILIHGLFDTTYFKNDLSAIFWLVLAFGIINSGRKSEQ